MEKSQETHTWTKRDLWNALSFLRMGPVHELHCMSHSPIFGGTCTPWYFQTSHRIHSKLYWRFQWLKRAPPTGWTFSSWWPSCRTLAAVAAQPSWSWVIGSNAGSEGLAPSLSRYSRGGSCPTRRGLRLKAGRVRPNVSTWTCWHWVVPPSKTPASFNASMTQGVAVGGRHSPSKKRLPCNCQLKRSGWLSVVSKLTCLESFFLHSSNEFAAAWQCAIKAATLVANAHLPHAGIFFCEHFLSSPHVLELRAHGCVGHRRGNPQGAEVEWRHGLCNTTGAASWKVCLRPWRSELKGAWDFRLEDKHTFDDLWWKPSIRLFLFWHTAF